MSMRFLARLEGRSVAVRSHDPLRHAELLAHLAQLHNNDEGQQSYLARHGERMAETLALTGRFAKGGVALELGSYLQMAWMLEKILGYRDVLCAGFGEPGTRIRKSIQLRDGSTYEKESDLFDVERDRFPHDDASLDLVLACELIEHLGRDPLHMLREIHRVLRPGGVLILTTPNCASLGSLANILYQVSNPYVYSLYPPAGSSETGHIREFVPAEICLLLAHAGFTVEEQFTRPLDNSPATHASILGMLAAWDFPTDMRGELYFVAARKGGNAPASGRPPSLYEP